MDAKDCVPRRDILKRWLVRDLARLANAGYVCRVSIKDKKDDIIDKILDKWSDIVDAVQKTHNDFMGCGTHISSTSHAVETSDDEEVDEDLYNDMFLQHLPKGYLTDSSDFDQKDDPKCAVMVKFYQPNGDYLFGLPVENPRIEIGELKVMVIDKVLELNPSSTLTMEAFKLYHEGDRMDTEFKLVTLLEWGSKELRLTLGLTLKGGGKSVQVKKDAMLKARIMIEKKKVVLEKMAKVNLQKLVVEQETINEAGKILSEIFKHAETNGIASFAFLLQKLKDENIGKKGNETSPLIEILKNSHTDMKTANLCDMLLRDSFPALYALADEVNAMIESAELTCEFVLNQAYMKANGHLGWALLKRAVEDEQTRRAPPAHLLGQDDADM